MLKSTFYLWAFSLGWLLLSTCNQPSTPLSEKNQIAQRACAYLWSQQASDGGWHSATHGIMKGGESLSAFVLWTLLEVPDSIFHKSGKQVNQGLQFIREHLNAEGALGLSDPDIMDYPNYATAYALRILSTYGENRDSTLIQKMTQYLLRQQFMEGRGISPEHYAYGAWGFGEVGMTKGMTGHVDLSHTRRVLQTLTTIPENTTKVRQQAQYFLRLLQKHPSESRLTNTETVYDGGFYASSVTVGTNKGGLIETSDSTDLYASYATATCDGLLALLASGYQLNDEPVQAALQWLSQMPELAFPQGIPQDNPAQWHLVLFYYHLSVRAEAYRAVQMEGNWQQQIVQLLKEQQSTEGAFANPMGAPNKEDDPLLATAFALIALAD